MGTNTTFAICGFCITGIGVLIAYLVLDEMCRHARRKKAQKRVQAQERTSLIFLPEREEYMNLYIHLVQSAEQEWKERQKQK